MKRGLVLFAVLAAGCADAPETEPLTVTDSSPAGAGDNGTAAGALITLRLPGMV